MFHVSRVPMNSLALRAVDLKEGGAPDAPRAWHGDLAAWPNQAAID